MTAQKPAIPNASAPHVFQAIAAVQREMSKIGIGKTETNQAQNYSFRGIDGVLNGLSPLLAQNNLVILPNVTARDVQERPTRSGGAMTMVVVTVTYQLVSAIDGTVTQVTTFGEAMDSADKATNKAMSAAYKYMAFQTFCIPTKGLDDGDADHPTLNAPAPLPPTGKPLTAAQAKKLQGLVRDNGITDEKPALIAQFAASVGCEPHQVTSAEFDAAITTLERRLEGIKARAAAKAAAAKPAPTDDDFPGDRP